MSDDFSGLEVRSGDGNWEITMSAHLVHLLPSLVINDESGRVTIRPTWLNEGGDALVIEVKYDDAPDVYRHLMTRKGTVEL